YYPNPTNDFWRIMGLLFEGDPLALYIPAEKRFDLERIRDLTIRHGIAMSDTVKKARRLRGNASDKYLDVVEGNDPSILLASIPACTDLATTGEKAAAVIAALTGTEAPAMGRFTMWKLCESRSVRIWRLPSTSRAYPLSLEKKSGYYRDMLVTAGVL
ncbi:MAG: uracil-DNA glycosylase family protein, partial [Muribaculaceae bacterium]|nr:uracil-DNA glycosylase family protein [Muribaculaceae bacterium]